ncbi:uncharacterized protein LOC130453143 [Diorhabda sublineata]|uniref:uncharacterized protein LOC130453143 n=1 Tax=Diorhabda sublineata TaxID=1163346 RepID=UPI0024E12C70|nr:uncharacterized protein LOC130453143 [Diorhabda sublineata]
MTAVYISPNISDREYQKAIDKTFETATNNNGGRLSIMAGDINAKSAIWGSPISDTKGQMVEEWLAQTGWVAINNGHHTFERGNSKTHIDVTLCHTSHYNKITNWCIEYINPYTHHGHIRYQIKTKGAIKKMSPNNRKRTYLNTEKYVEILKKSNGTYEEILKAYKDASNNNDANTSMQPFWWNPEIENARKEYNKHRRKYTREKLPHLKQKWEDGMKLQGKVLKSLIMQAKKRCWDDLMKDIENDIWGQGYRIVTGKLANRTQGQLSAERRKNILRTLFPTTRGKMTTTTNEIVSPVTSSI